MLWLLSLGEIIETIEKKLFNLKYYVTEHQIALHDLKHKVEKLEKKVSFQAETIQKQGSKINSLKRDLMLTGTFVSKEKK